MTLTEKCCWFVTASLITLALCWMTVPAAPAPVYHAHLAEK